MRSRMVEIQLSQAPLIDNAMPSSASDTSRNESNVLKQCEQRLLGWGVVTIEDCGVGDVAS